MAEAFIGMKVAVLLNSQATLQGIVSAVQGSQLTLDNVTEFPSGRFFERSIVNGVDIQELDVIEDVAEVTPTVQLPPQPSPHELQLQQQYQFQLQQQQQHQQQQQQQQQQQLPTPPVAAPHFVDPAIVAFSQGAAMKPAPQSPIPQMNAQFPDPQLHQRQHHNIPRNFQQGTGPQGHARNISTKAASKQFLHPSHVPGQMTSHQRPRHREAVSTQTLPNQNYRPAVAKSKSAMQSPISHQFGDLSLKDPAVDSSVFDETDDPLASNLPADQAIGKFSRVKVRRGGKGKDMLGFGSNTARRQQKNGDGYRQKRGQRYYQQGMSAAEDGWATEDVNDIKDLEFDFQSNLQRFDKKTVFSQIKAEDTTAVEDRLVSINKVVKPIPKVSGSQTIRKNFKNSENVLGTYVNGQSLLDREQWDDNTFLVEAPSDSGSTSDDEDEDDLGGNSGRSSRRGVARPARRPKNLRKASAADRGGDYSNMSSGVGSGGGGGGAGSGSLEPKAPKPTLRLLPSNRPCPIVSPLQMIDVERIAEVELGLTEDIINENAGRGIAQIAIQAFGKRIHVANHNALPVILILAGNNKSGARAVAAGRHLKNHHVRVLICVLGLEHEDELLENVRRQISMFRNAGGRLTRGDDLMSNLKNLDSPVELIIDGLLGMHMAFEDLRVDNQATVFELITLANKNKANVLAVDVPSGIDGHSGKVTTIEDTGDLYIKAKWVVAMGAPKTGVLNAVSTGVGAPWSLFVVDIGIPNTAWRKYGTRRRHGVEFGADWILPLEYCPPPLPSPLTRA